MQGNSPLFSKKKHFGMKETSSFGRSNAFFDSFKRHLLGYRSASNKGKPLSQQGLRAYLTTFCLYPKHFTPIRKIPFAYTQNRLLKILQ